MGPGEAQHRKRFRANGDLGLGMAKRSVIPGEVASEVLGRHRVLRCAQRGVRAASCRDDGGAKRVHIVAEATCREAGNGLFKQPPLQRCAFALAACERLSCRGEVAEPMQVCFGGGARNTCRAKLIRS